jgi:hypothetical protein
MAPTTDGYGCGSVVGGHGSVSGWGVDPLDFVGTPPHDGRLQYGYGVGSDAMAGGCGSRNQAGTGHGTAPGHGWWDRGWIARRGNGAGPAPGGGYWQGRGHG